MPSKQILSMNLRGILISNGPGDPRSLKNVIETVGELIGKIPIFGICLGHQILSLACGLEVKKSTRFWLAPQTCACTIVLIINLFATSRRQTTLNI